jgi:hypothetical protein
MMIGGLAVNLHRIDSHGKMLAQQVSLRKHVFNLKLKS